MRLFTTSERTLISKLAVWNRGNTGSMEDFLAKNVFTEQALQAVIIQPQRRYAVLYHIPDITEAKLDELERSFFELLTFLSWLRSAGYITVYNGLRSKSSPTLYYLHESFDQPHIEDKTIVLNQAGDFTLNPELIQDKTGDVLFKGTLLQGDLYHLVLSNMTGTVCVSQALSGLLAPAPSEAKSVDATPAPHRNKGPKVLDWTKIVAAVAVVLAHSAVGYVGLRVHKMVDDVATSVENLHRKHEELTKKITLAPQWPPLTKEDERSRCLAGQRSGDVKATGSQSPP